MKSSYFNIFVMVILLLAVSLSGCAQLQSNVGTQETLAAAKGKVENGDIEGAIRLYEQNVLDEVDTPHPYSRLAIIYRKQNRLVDEIRILETAIKVFGQSEHWEKQLAKAREKQQH